MNNRFLFSDMGSYFFIVLFVVFENLLSEVPRPSGVSLSKASLYLSGKDFTCLDGSQTIPFTKVNDDYCDCFDASDEPGTSACPHGVFHCTNAGHKPLNIPSNRVNDGVCDCCDGTDEYYSEINCSNNCINLGKTAREAAQRHAELIKAGKQLRSEYIQKGVQLRQEKQAKLKELLILKEEYERIRNEKEIIKNDAEKIEKASLEYYQKIKEENDRKRAEDEEMKNRAEAQKSFDSFDINQDGVLDISEIQSGNAFDKDADGVVSEEEALYFMNNQVPIDFENFVNNCWSTVKHYTTMTADENNLYTSTAKDEIEATSSPDVEQEELDQDDEEDFEQLEKESTPSEQETKTETSSYDEETQKQVEKANNARAEYQDADQQLKNFENEINKIKEYLETDFGSENEYAVLQGQCFDYHDNEYVYKLCPFDQTSQQPKSSSSDTRLGSWGKWSGSERNKYDQMTFENGQSCWNGPQRSTIVKIDCGGENRIISVTEPNRCEYLMNFITPAACQVLPKDSYEELHDEL